MRLFPLSFYWQIFATGIMGVVVMALIPQQTARTVITSQMLINLSESLGYKTPSKASTGLFVASFLGLGQLGFLFSDRLDDQPDRLGSAAERRAGSVYLGLLVSRGSAADPGGHHHHLGFARSFFRPESQPKISYTMVQTQLNILGPLFTKEWISLGVCSSRWVAG